MLIVRCNNMNYSFYDWKLDSKIETILATYLRDSIMRYSKSIDTAFFRNKLEPGL